MSIAIGDLVTALNGHSLLMQVVEHER